VSVFYVTFLRFIEVDLIWVFVRRQWNGISFCKRNVGRQAEFAGHQGVGEGVERGREHARGRNNPQKKLPNSQLPELTVGEM